MDVSVLIISYNEEKYIAQALESVINQETKYSYEIVVADDCSTDNTSNIIMEYASKYPDKIRPILRPQNVGPFHNGNQAMGLLTGKYYMYLEGDDYWLPGKIEKQINFMERHPEIGMCYGQVFSENERTGVLSPQKTGYYSTTFKDILEHNPANTCTQCGRLNLYKRYCEEINPLKYGWLMQDYPLVLWHAKYSKLYAFDDAFAVYRIREGSLSHPDKLEKNLAFTKSTMDIQKFFTSDEDDIEKIERIYHNSVAENYWIFGDMKGFRECYKSCLKKYPLRRLDKLKYVLSFFPFFGSIIKVYVRTRSFKM
jgi:glycosyltransferase involved in cell wall biosynthesis